MTMLVKVAGEYHEIVDHPDQAKNDAFWARYRDWMRVTHPDIWNRPIKTIDDLCMTAEDVERIEQFKQLDDLNTATDTMC